MAWGEWILAPRSGSQPQGSRQNTPAGQKPNPRGRAETGKASTKELQDDASRPLKAGDGNKHDGEKSRKRRKEEGLGPLAHVVAGVHADLHQWDKDTLKGPRARLQKLQDELNTVLSGPLTDEAAIKQQELYVEIEEMLEKEELY
ncbi:hypothetical protein D1007_04556 [Hordeum vulgare]|nr:hypothetical protein D1007_04556 [Hordeum vulgare]